LLQGKQSSSVGLLDGSAAAPQPAGRQRLSDVATRVSVFPAAGGRAGGVEEGSRVVSSGCSSVRQIAYTSIRVVQFGTGLLLGQESNECRVFVLSYGLSRLAIVFNNVLYMYKVLKDIYTWCFSGNFGGTAVPPCIYCRSAPVPNACDVVYVIITTMSYQYDFKWSWFPKLIGLKVLLVINQWVILSLDVRLGDVHRHAQSRPRCHRDMATGVIVGKVVQTSARSSNAAAVQVWCCGEGEGDGASRRSQRPSRSV